MVSYEEFHENLEKIQEAIAHACLESDRPINSVKILPVTKSHPVEAVKYSHRAGLPSVGESRVQEAIEKQAEVSFRIEWEFIGHLQSNKAALAVEHFSRIQSIDSKKLLDRVNHFAKEKEKIMRVLLQVNAGDDPAKHGVACDEVEPLLENALSLSNIKLEGFMTIAPLDDNPEVAKRTFMNLREIRDKLQPKYATALPELSMGMTGDFIQAIEAGSTLVRIGSALFGERSYS